MAKFRAKILIRANAQGSDLKQLSDEALKGLDWFKETDYEIIDAVDKYQAADILTDQHLPPMGIVNPDITVTFDDTFKG